MNARRYAYWLLALAAVVVAGIQVVYASHAVREQHTALQAAQLEQDAALLRYSRLQLELAAVAAYQNVERTAEEELDMAFPRRVERLEP